MKIKCLHGYFIFEETKSGEISHFNSLFALDLVPEKNYYTFKSLKDAPNYSLAGANYLGAPATITYEGKPHEIMKANSLIYDFEKDLLVPISSVARVIDVVPAGYYFLSSGLILPGSVAKNGSRVKDYAGWFSFDTIRFKYSEVSYV